MNIVLVLSSFVGGVLRALRNRESRKCVNFHQLSSSSGSVRATRLEKGCEKLFKLLPNGNIKEDGSENVCISGNRAQGVLSAIDCPANGDVSFTTKGAMSRPDPPAEKNSLPGYACFYVIDKRSLLIGLSYDWERNRCEEKGNFFEFLGKSVS